jgi:hypothetical protein
MNVTFRQYCGDVVIDRVGGDGQPTGHLGVAEPVREQSNDVSLASGLHPD